MSSGIYKITNTVNGHCYIGSAVDIQGRWSSHISKLNKNKHHSRYLQRAWLKYGADAFSFSVIEYCFPLALIFREQHFINTLKPEYNMLPIAGSSLGMKFTPESRAKMSLAAKASMTPERLAKMSEATKKQKRRLGYKHTDKARAHMSAARKTSQPPEHLARMRELAKKPEARAKIAEANKKRIWTAESRAKISVAHKGKKESPETIAKLLLVWAKRKAKGE